MESEQWLVMQQDIKIEASDNGVMREDTNLNLKIIGGQELVDLQKLK